VHFELIIARGKVELFFFACAVTEDGFLAATERGVSLGRRQHHCYSGAHSRLLFRT